MKETTEADKRQTPSRWWGIAICFGLLALSVWLFIDNRRLRDALAAKPTVVENTKLIKVKSPATLPTTTPGKQFEQNTSSTDDDQQEATEEPAREDRRARRMRRMEAISLMLGRNPDESAEDYRARVTPMVKAFLDARRERVNTWKEEAFAEAEVTAEQRQALDGVFADTYDEALDVVNQAIATGDLTPYRRNPAGVMAATGNLGTLLTATETRIGSVLSKEQRARIDATGFSWAEYLGVNAPWEDLNAPPPRDP